MAETATSSPMPGGGKPKDKTVAEIEKLARQRESRRKSAVMFKQRRESEIRDNEKRGRPGDVDFQRMIRRFRKHEMEPAREHEKTGPLKINVVVRKRPVSDTEVRKKDYDAVSCSHPRVYVHHSKLKVDGITKYLDNVNFELDHAFHESATNDDVYENTAKYLVEFAVGGGRATCFAYGQTGSGKTFTMAGVQALAAGDVFRLASRAEQTGLEVHCAFFELYGGRCIDLLHDRRVCSVREDGKGRVQVEGLKELLVCDEEELLQLIERGNSSRTTHATEMNSDSSRSHAICQISLRQVSARPGAEPFGKLSLIDLAGSERGQDTKHHNSQRRQESAEINKSLLALKECVRALDSASSHVPYRASKLTMILKDSFSQDARTVMISCISPVSSSSDHTLNTLRYADRVKEKHVRSAPGPSKRLSICNSGSGAPGSARRGRGGAGGGRAGDDSSDDSDSSDSSLSGGQGQGRGRGGAAGQRFGRGRGAATIDEGDEHDDDDDDDDEEGSGSDAGRGRGQGQGQGRSRAAGNSGVRGDRPKGGKARRGVASGSQLPRATPVKAPVPVSVSSPAPRKAVAKRQPAKSSGRQASQLAEPGRRTGAAAAAAAAARGASKIPSQGQGQQGSAQRRKEWDDPAKVREPLHPHHNANVMSNKDQSNKDQSGKARPRRMGERGRDDDSNEDDDDNLSDDDDLNDAKAGHRSRNQGKAQSQSQSQSQSRNSAAGGKGKGKTAATEEEEEEVVNFHDMVAQLVDMEEELLSAHMHSIQKNADLLTEEGALLSKVQGADVVDYDIDEYASRLDDIIVAKLDLFSNLHGALKKFRSHLALENKAVVAAP